MDMNYDKFPWYLNTQDSITGQEYSLMMTDAERTERIARGTSTPADFSPRRDPHSWSPEQKARLMSAFRVAPSPHLHLTPLPG